MRNKTSFRLFGILIFLIIFSLHSCESGGFTEIKGETMGTYYQLKYRQSRSTNFQSEIDSILIRINQETSTYIPDSYISLFNQSTGGIPLVFGEEIPFHFETNYLASIDVFQKTSGAFDPTVMPLVNYWGFGYEPKRHVTNIDSLAIDTIQQLVGMEKTNLKDLRGQKTLLKSNSGVQLDFSAIAKGYAVDYISEWLESKGITDYLVEIGGELRTAGHNAKNENWLVGINTPRKDASLAEVQAFVSLSGMSMASSGNYRNFYEENGQIFSHTINPYTGFPERTNLLAVSIITKECIYADAYATACMVLGLEKGQKFIASQKNLEACFFYADEFGEIKEAKTEGFNKYILE